MFVSQAAWDSSKRKYVSEGWWSIAAGSELKVAAGKYIHVQQGGKDQLGGKSGQSEKFYYHPSKRFEVMSSNNKSSGEWYLDGVRTSTKTLSSKGFKTQTFKKFTDGSELRLGNYWKVGMVSKSFSHNSNGTKQEKFSHFKNKIISYKVSGISSRGVRIGPLWTLSPDRMYLSMIVTLQGGPFYDPWRPSYKGKVELLYIYR
jgi:hypothetical protein